MGGGMSGLLTWLCLHASGFHNLEIIEAGRRLWGIFIAAINCPWPGSCAESFRGSRVHTEHLQGCPSDHQYQEVGPMRFPESIQYPNHKNKTLEINDHKIVFQLARTMDKLNNFAKNSLVDFIPWIQNNRNGLFYFNGIKKRNRRPFTLAEVQKHPKKFTFERRKSNELLQITNDFNKISMNPYILAKAAKNVFKTHKKFFDLLLRIGRAV